MCVGVPPSSASFLRKYLCEDMNETTNLQMSVFAKVESSEGEGGVNFVLDVLQSEKRDCESERDRLGSVLL